MVVAIDGPVAAGKTSVANRVAALLKYSLLDTGAIYRTLALHCLQETIDWSDQSRVSEAAENLAVGFHQDGTSNRVWLSDQDVTESIRTAEISQGASIVSAIPGVRRGLLDIQRSLGATGDIVAEGRDIGTVVFPEAEVKIFLTAKATVRAQRRYDELMERGQKAKYDEVLNDLRERDHRDTTRASAPLIPAEDAHTIDSSKNSIEEVTQTIIDLIQVYPKTDK